ncbi:MAG: hypothetical protein J3K34DRAFT_456322 [Monoraphidium minutum]|nr:MAG: hypothetical protein J3K34DRAFT_456322 [Monoraphidium minutum]
MAVAHVRTHTASKGAAVIHASALYFTVHACLLTRFSRWLTYSCIIRIGAYQPAARSGSFIQNNVALLNGGGVNFYHSQTPGIDAQAGGTLEIDSTLLTDNTGNDYGGALYLGLGTRAVTITGSKLDRNRVNKGGAAIFSQTDTFGSPERAVSISGSTLMNNSMPYVGYTGIAAFDTITPLSVTIDTCTIAGNSGTPNVYFWSRLARVPAMLTVSQCTFDVAVNPAIHHVGTCGLRVESSTFWSNPANAGTGKTTLGAAMMVEGTLGATITNVVVASCGTVRPCMYVPDTNAAKVNVTYSLFEAQPLDKQWFKEGTINCTADLGPLQDNGGPGPTRIPGPGSPALQSGSNAAAAALTTDQRGLPRIAGGVVDMGAVEVQSQGGSFSKCSLFNSTGLIAQVVVAPPSTFFCNEASSCRTECEARAACMRFLVHGCSDECCTEAGTGYTCATMATNGMASLAKPGGSSFGTLCARYYQSVATTCNLTDPSNFKPGAVLGDPHLVGFDGTPFLFKGYPDAVFTLISEQSHMVNALFGNIGPAHGLDTDVWMVGFGARYGTALELELRLDVDPRDIELFRDEAAKHDTKMRVRLLDPKFLHIVVNGAHRDDLLRSGRAVEGLVGGATLYFPPPNAVNPGDASDGPLAILKTPLMELAFYLETEDALHLDMQARPHAPPLPLPLPPLRGRHCGGDRRVAAHTPNADMGCIYDAGTNMPLPAMRLRSSASLMPALAAATQVKLLDRPYAMSGVLGQTLKWALDGDSGGAVEDGVLAGDDSRFEVGDGIMGTRYDAGLFQSGGGAAGPGAWSPRSAGPLLGADRLAAAGPRALLALRMPTLAAFPLVAGSGSRLLL